MSIQNRFTMNLPDGMVPRLASTGWGKQLFNFRDGKDHLFIAVRDNYLSVYIEGRAVFKKIEEKGGKLVAVFDQRYLLGKDVPSGDLYFDGEKVFSKNDQRVERDDTPLNFAAWVSRVKNYDLADPDNENNDVREKGCLATRALSPSVIDLLPDLPSFISRVCSGFGPCWGGLQTRSV